MNTNTSILAIMLVLTLSATRSESNILKNTQKERGLINRICLNKFKAALKKSGKVAPVGMEQFTCNCFTKEIRTGKSFANAISTCKSKSEIYYQQQTFGR